MKEYIEREAVLNAIKSAFFDQQCDCEVMPDVFKRVQEVEAADVALVRHGRWKYYHKQNRAVCTCCSFERDLGVDFGRAVACPNCGALMDGKEDNNA